MRQEFDTQVIKLQKQLEEKQQSINYMQSIEELKNSIKNFLKQKIDFEILDDTLIKMLFDTIIINGDRFQCYLKITENKSLLEERALIETIIIKFDEAKEFKNRMGSYLRFRDWNDMVLKIYL